jgi:hypothetical protein
MPICHTPSISFLIDPEQGVDELFAGWKETAVNLISLHQTFTHWFHRDAGSDHKRIV